MNLTRLIPRALLLAVIVGAIFWAAVYREQFDATSLDRWLTNLGLWAPVVHALLFAVGTIVFLPGSLFALAGGALFGPVWGAILNLVGATFGASLAFLIARYLAGDWVARKSGGHLKRLVDGVEKEGWRFVAFVRLVPLFPFNLTNYALGLTRIGFLPYVITSFICMAPGAVAFGWLGHAGQGALSGDASAIRYGLYALGLLAVIAFVPRLIKQMRQGRIAWIEADELQKQMKSGAALTILDVRGPDEFVGALGHISGAANIPVGDIANRLIEIKALGNKPVIMVCKTDRRSAQAAEILRNENFADVRVLRGGMERWNQIGLEVKGGAPDT
ncbi:MAG: VTT domain-containing protein [Aestuariivirga sp.]|nr:VTT domain-containing protein [Aestuariivirga sp.]